MIWFEWYMFAFVYFPIFLYILFFANAVVIHLEVKREYDVKKVKRTIFENFMTFINFLIQCFIPLYNLMLLFAMFNRDIWKDAYIKRLKDEGLIIIEKDTN